MDKQELVRRFGQGLEPISEVLQSLHTFSAESAERLQQEFDADVQELLRRMAGRLSAATAGILEERFLSQEDEDSSAMVHLLMRLKDRADSLMRGDT